jgi:hypothetical protein
MYSIKVLCFPVIRDELFYGSLRRMGLRTFLIYILNIKSGFGPPLSSYAHLRLRAVKKP